MTRMRGAAFEAQLSTPAHPCFPSLLTPSRSTLCVASTCSYQPQKRGNLSALAWELCWTLDEPHFVEALISLGS